MLSSCSFFQQCFSKRFFIPFIILGVIFLTINFETLAQLTDAVQLYPTNGQSSVNPDVQLKITFQGEPLLGDSGKIYIYDAVNDELVDMLDMSIPPGPRNSRTLEAYKNLRYDVEEAYIEANKNEKGKVFVQLPIEDIYQKKYLGGKLESDVYHFYPVLINKNTATICPRNNKLSYNKTYYVKIDPGVLSIDDTSSFGIVDNTTWIFTTKEVPPSAEKETYIVSSDGSEDFNTVQGAIDFIPEIHNLVEKTIFIKNGRYEEIVYFRKKNNISIIGEDREKTIICYANNGFFNPRPTGARIEMIKRFRNRRSVFAAHNSNSIKLVNFTVKSLGERPAQAEGLLVRGKNILVHSVTIDASGDALQATGNIYIENTSIKGFGDNVLGYGAVFFKNCDFISTYGPHLWPRNTSENHGNVLVNCNLWTLGDVDVTISRAPIKQHYSFPYSETVLINCKLEGVKPEGFGLTDSLCKNSRYWEFNSKNKNDGNSADISQRVHYSRQLSMDNDSVNIANYSNPGYVLNGWTPQLAPVIISQPQSVCAEKGQKLEFGVEVAALPEATYQWLRNGKAIKGANSQTYTIPVTKSKNVGEYSVHINNGLGEITSKPAIFEIDDSK